MRRLLGVALMAALGLVLAKLLTPDTPGVWSSTVSERPAPGVLSALMLTDMGRPGEARPHGVPATYDWAGHGRRRPIPRRGYAAFIPWGHLYNCASSHVATREPVELRNLDGWVLRRSTGSWTAVRRSSELSGGAFPERYAGQTLAPNIVRQDGMSTVVRLTPEHNFHFWPAQGRASVPSTDIQAIAVTVRARFVHRTNACAVLGVGGDLWRTVSQRSGGPGNVTDVGIGRFKRVDARWRAFTMTTASAALLDLHPVPSDIPAAELR